MLTTTLNEQDQIAILEPDGPLSTADFQAASAIIDPFIEKTGDLRGRSSTPSRFPAGIRSRPCIPI